MSDVKILPDDSAFFIAEIPIGPNLGDPITWNPWNKVVHDHRDGSVIISLTNIERRKRALPTPWTPEMIEIECRQPPIA